MAGLQMCHGGEMIQDSVTDYFALSHEVLQPPEAEQKQSGGRCNTSSSATAGL